MATNANTKATLIVAAKVMADVSPTAGTMLDVLHDHAFRHYAQGLRQYLAIRSGGAEAGDSAFTELRRRAAAVPPETLAEAPGVRARLYRIARELAPEKKAKIDGTLNWYRPRSPKQKHHTAVARIRSQVQERELLELRYARELTPREIAYVLEVPEPEIESRLEGALDQAKGLFRGGSGSLPGAVLEAFALEKISMGTEPTALSGDPDLSEEERARLPEATIVGHRYRLSKHIGAGGFADVYRAEDIEVPGHIVAIKVLRGASTSEENRQQALKELRIIAAVYHPSIVQFKDHGWHEGRLWFVMPWYEGQVLEDLLDEGGIDRAKARRVFESLARALATLHAAGIRHQDIKPDNIFLARLKGFGGDGTQEVLPVLLDLGVAAKDAELVLAGTPTYFSPEVAAQFAYREGDPFPERPIGPAADVFALALSLRNALEPETQPDVPAGAVESFIRARAADEVSLFTRPDLKYLNKSLRRWLAPEPNDRPTADEFADELAILTLPEERRARRIGYLKLFGPLLIAAAIVFGMVFQQFRERAAEINAKADLAEQEAANALASLEDESTRREELEAQVEDARELIRADHLTHEQLEQQLADATGSLNVSRRRLIAARRLVDQAEKATEAVALELRVAQGRVTSAERRLGEVEANLATRDQEVAIARRELAEIRGARDAAESNLRQARRDVQLAQEAQATERARSAEAEASAANAERALRATQRELAEAQARIRTLERQLAAARTPAPVNVNTPTVMVPTPVLPNGTNGAPTIVVPRRAPR